ncbi:type II toxin-antitoxin system RelE/ParE family toxin [Embleya sp. NPDC020630]|uniref:type II toxin-antitoxin system RelE/ParE family toxin n=1 Tax=Embleya sp. NPDC020630 TaxID=3363979 RepID=UPI0037A7D220
MTYRIEYTNPPQAELRAMDAKTRAAFDNGITAVARDPYGAGSKPYPGGGSDDHRITQVGGVAIITYQVSRSVLLVTVVKLVAR